MTHRETRVRGRLAILALALALAVAACGGVSADARRANAQASAGDAVLAGAGDSIVCGSARDHDVGRLLGNLGGAVFAAGDISPSGTLAQFSDCYGASWGWFKDRTRPVPGEDEWQTPDLAGYRAYWGTAATNAGGDPWYSFELGAWHVVMLDSDCDQIGGCGSGSPEGRWLSTDLAGAAARCTMAIWHHPRFSSGQHGDHREVAWFWYALDRAGADVIVSAHDTDYERFAPQAPNQTADPAHGIREFVVGTGGATLHGFGAPQPNSEFRESTAFGVIEFALHPASYDWRFISTDDTILDSGSGTCH